MTPLTIRKSAEDYLEAILIVQKRKGYVRSLDVSRQLGVSKPSVSAAVKQLMDGGYVAMEDGKLLSLTESGKAVAERIYERHCVLKEILTTVGILPETAEEEACKIEHDISDESFRLLKKYWTESQTAR